MADNSSIHGPTLAIAYEDTLEFPRSPTKPESTIPDRIWVGIGPMKTWFLRSAICIVLFFAALDVTIVSTALYKISSDLHDAQNLNWLPGAYLLTNTGFLLTVAKASDIVGIKHLLLFCSFTFLSCSIGCAAAKSMTLLITFRALQGIGGAGLYTLPFILALKVPRPEEIVIYITVIGVTFSLANMLGPITGGTITDHMTWRWIFWLNVPFLTFTIVIFWGMCPWDQAQSAKSVRLRRVDWFGCLFWLCWVIPLVVALQEGGLRWDWVSAKGIPLVVIAGVFLMCFAVWEVFRYRNGEEQIVPLHILKDPVVALLMANTLFLGAGFYGGITLLGERYQAVNALSPIRTGVQLLIMTIFSGVAGFVSSRLSKKWPRLKEPLVLLANVLMLASMTIFSTLSTDQKLPYLSYLGQFFLGTGFGLQTAVFMFIIKCNVPFKDLSSAVGIRHTCGALGGCIGIAIASAISHSQLRDDLSVLPEKDSIALLESFHYVDTLPPWLAKWVRVTYGENFNHQFWALAIVAALNIVVAILMVLFANYKVELKVRKRQFEKPESLEREEMT